MNASMMLRANAWSVLLRFACCSWAGVLGSACSGEDPPDTGTPSTGSRCPDEQTLTYDNFARNFFESYCTRCHSEMPAGGSRNGAPAGYNWDNLDTIRSHAREIERVAAGGPQGINNIMPPSDPRPSDDERLELGEWLACGAP